MPNYYLSVLYKHIIQVKNKNVGLKVGGHKHTFAPPIKKVGGHMPPLPPPASYASEWLYTALFFNLRITSMGWSHTKLYVINNGHGLHRTSFFYLMHLF